MANSKNKRSKSKSSRSKDQIIEPIEQPGEESSDVALKSDLLDDFLFHAANYIYVRRKLFITLSVVIIVLIVSGWGTFKYLNYKDSQRNKDLFQIEKIVYDNQLTEEQIADQALPLLNQFLAEHEGSEQYNLALFYRAGINAKLNHYQEAEGDFKALLSTLKPDSDLFFLASLYLSNVLRDQNKKEEAIEVLQGAKSESLADIILMEQAELYLSNDQTDKAKQMLEILLKDYPKSLYASKAKQLLQTL